MYIFKGMREKVCVCERAVREKEKKREKKEELTKEERRRKGLKRESERGKVGREKS
jgi:hypothetical protein